MSFTRVCTKQVFDYICGHIINFNLFDNGVKSLVGLIFLKIVGVVLRISPVVVKPG
jgi:hypothetical protein